MRSQSLQESIRLIWRTGRRQNVLLETDYGMMTIHGDDLHVRRLSVEKGEVDVDGCIDAIQYSDVKNYAKKGSSVMSRLFG